MAYGFQLPNCFSNLFLDCGRFVVKQSGKDADTLHQLLGKLRLLCLLTINELKCDLSALTEPPNADLLKDWPQLGSRFAQCQVKLPVEETCVPLTVLKKHFVRVRWLSD
ncbi:hypothetical protein D3C84_602590 [compost metagenome]